MPHDSTKHYEENQKVALVSLSCHEYNKLSHAVEDFCYITDGLLLSATLSESGDDLDYSDTKEFNRRLRRKLPEQYVMRINELRSGGLGKWRSSL